MSSIKSRIFAYIIDMCIVSIIFILFSSIVPERRNYNELNNELEEVTQQFVDGKLELDVFINRQAEITQDIDKENVFLNVMQAMLIIGYFIVLPYCMDGKTIGKKMMKIKIVSTDGELEYNNLIIRALLINGLGYILILLGCVYILPSVAYSFLTMFLSALEIIILIVSLIKMKKNEDHEGLHDALAHTKVIEI